MKKSAKVTFVVFLGLAMSSSLLGQTPLQTVNFETDGSGYTVQPQEYTVATGGSAPDYWTRTNGGAEISPSTAFSNIEGQWFFAGEDVDYDLYTTKYYVTCSPVNISGYSNLMVKLLLGGRTGTTIEVGDFVKIQYQLDGGGYTTLAQFLGDGTLADAYLEDADANGTVDTPNVPLSAILQEFTYSIPSTGSMLQIRIHVYNGTAEEVAFDNIRVLGTVLPTVNFTDGSDFSPSITKGSANQVIGRFELAGDLAGASLTAASVKLDGTRSGLTNLKLWESTDATFGSDTQVGSTVSSDPGDGNSASFSSFSSAIGTGGTYYFLTGDVSAEASGIVQGVLVNNSSLTVSNGTLSSTITNAPLSNGDASLPVGLSSFSAQAEGHSIVLSWITESETDNAGFILEKREENSAWVQIASYKTHDELKGKGTASNATEYTFKDDHVAPGINYSYRLSDVSSTDEIMVYPPLSITMDYLPLATKMDNPYPSPFNSRTFISYHLTEDIEINISVFDLLGRQVKILFAGQQFAGSHQVYWNGNDKNGMTSPSGIYMIRMQAEKTTQIHKVLFVK